MTTGTRRLMIDTHVLLWMLTDPSRFPRRLRERLADRETDLFVSAASAWEVGTKHRLGKLPQADGLVQGYQQHAARLGVESLSVTAEHALLAGAMEWPHRDPFDRVIAAQCMIESLPLVTKDEAFATAPGIRVVW